jgi:hypothetical protein
MDAPLTLVVFEIFIPSRSSSIIDAIDTLSLTHFHVVRRGVRLNHWPEAAYFSRDRDGDAMIFSFAQMRENF